MIWLSYLVKNCSWETGEREQERYRLCRVDAIDALSTFMSDDVTDGLRSTHEEADTKLILHAVHAADRRATRIRIFPPDTDVLVLAIRRQPCSQRTQHLSP